MPNYTLTVTSELNKLESIARFVCETASAMGMDDETIYAVQLAVDEACTNIMDYAYKGRPGQPVTIECSEQNGRCVVVIRDRGRPFDPGCVAPPNLKAPLSKRKIGGLGIFIMRKLMDDVCFQYSPGTGNELTLIKAFQRQEPKRGACSSWQVEAT
jgi:anti-sigma regulatory factor (Ser/Thr protein kinase)